MPCSYAIHNNTLFADGVPVRPCAQATSHPPLVPVQQTGCQSGDVEECGAKRDCIVRCDVCFNVILFVL